VRSTALVTAVLVGLLVTACSTGTTGTAEPGNPPGGSAAPSSGPPSSAPNTHGAPQVTNPLNVSKYLADPCATITSAQLAGLHLSSVKGVEDKAAIGNSCHWTLGGNTVYTVGFTVSFASFDGPGLSSIYSQAGGPRFIQRLPDSNGVPAVTEPSQDTNGSSTTPGDYTIFLGVTDKLLFATNAGIDSSLISSHKASTIARQLADDATATMRSGG
jgi:hypothetical protein